MRSAGDSSLSRGAAAAVGPAAEASVRTGIEGVLLSTRTHTAAFSRSAFERRSRTQPTLGPRSRAEMVVRLIWLWRLDSTEHGAWFVII